MLKKLGNKVGSAMTLAIIVLLIVGIGGITMTSMVINQIKSTKSNSDSVDLKYKSEAEVEKVIGEYIDKISIDGERVATIDASLLIWFFMISHQYAEAGEGLLDGYNTDLYNQVNEIETLLEDYISEGCSCMTEDDCDTCELDYCKGNTSNNKKPENNKICNVEKINKIKYENLTDIKDKLDKLLTNLGTHKDSVAAMEIAMLLGTSRDYINLIIDNLFDGENIKYSGFTEDQCNQFIEQVIESLSVKNYSYIKNETEAISPYGTIGLFYRNMNIVYGIENHDDADEHDHSCIYTIEKRGGSKQYTVTKKCIICNINKSFVGSEPNKLGVTIYDTNNEDSQFGTITKDIAYLLSGEGTATSILEKIDSTNYTNLTDDNVIIGSFEKKSSLYEKNEELMQFYGISGDFDGKGSGGKNHDILTPQLTAIRYEINFLKYFLQIYKDINGEGQTGGTIGNDSILTVKIPKEISLESNAKAEPLKNDIDSLKVKEGMGYIGEEDNFYIFKPTTEMYIPFHIDVTTDNSKHNINSNVLIKIGPLLNDTEYNIEYFVKEWDKVS